MSPLAFADYAVIAAFFAVMVGVGFFYSRRSKSSDQFFGNDKSVPWWLSGVSFYMNSFSALAFVMYSALAYKFGWVPVTVSWLSVPAVLLGAWFLAVRWRRAAKGSPIDYIATRYTPGMCRTLAILGLPMQLLDNALKLLAIGTVVGVGMGFPLFWSICISGVIIVLYTFLGGLKATLTCDFIQFLVILAVVFTLPVLCLERLAAFGAGAGASAPTGLAALGEGLRVFIEKTPTGFFDFTAGKYTWVYMLVFFCCVGSTLSTNWSLVQRYYSTKSERDAKKMAYLVAVLLFLGPPLFFFPAMAARVFLPDIAEAEMNGVYALVCRSVLPSGMIGMVIAAMFSATMSSLAGNFNAAAAVLTDALKLKGLLAARLATIVVGGLVVALTFVMQYAQGADDLFNLSNKVFGVFLPPIAIPMLCGVFVRRFTKRAGMFGLVGGIAVGLALFVAGGWHPFLREMIWIFPLTAVATIAFLILGTVLRPDGAAERGEVEAFFRKLATPAVVLLVVSVSAAEPWVGELPATFASGAAVPSLETTVPKAQLVAGDWTRFAHVWARLDRGEAIRIAVIGGSITQGAGASSRERQWGSMFVAGWRRAFPTCTIDFVNAGIGATGSEIGAFRLARDVLAKKPDVVAVEFAVNDAPGRERAESYEGVIRQLLKDPRGIAVIQLGMVSQGGNSAQVWQARVATHYQVPFVSYRDALYYPYVKEGTVKWRDISPDTVHPNDVGHAYAAALLNETLRRHYVAYKAAGRTPAAIPALPKPLYGTRYDKGRFSLMQDTKILENKGFFPLRDNCWGIGLACTNAHGRLVFEVEGPTVALLYRLGNKPYNWGKIAVKIDGTDVVRGLDCFRDQWWWYTPSLFLCRDKPGRHVVEVETLGEKNAQSAAYGCHLTGVLVSEETAE